MYFWAGDLIKLRDKPESPLVLVLEVKRDGYKVLFYGSIVDQISTSYARESFTLVQRRGDLSCSRDAIERRVDK